MKTIIIFFAIICLSISSSAQNQTQDNLAKKNQKNIQSDTLVFTVYGMGCPGCEGGLEKQVNKIQSVQFSDADWIKQELRIVLAKDFALDMTELKKRIKKANFTLKENTKENK